MTGKNLIRIFGVRYGKIGCGWEKAENRRINCIQNKSKFSRRKYWEKKQKKKNEEKKDFKEINQKTQLNEEGAGGMFDLSQFDNNLKYVRLGQVRLGQVS